MCIRDRCTDALEFKEQKAEWSKELKDSVNQVAEHWNEKFIVAKQEQGMERKAVSEQVHKNINKTQELEARVIRLEIVVSCLIKPQRNIPVKKIH